MNDTGTRGRECGMGLPAFLGMQVVLMGLALGWAGYCYRQRVQEDALPPLRDMPIRVAPLYDYDWVVTDEQLVRVLRKLRPRFAGKKTQIFNTDHHLRCWTAEASFNDPQFMSGADMLRLLTDHCRFVEVYGGSAPPLLMDGSPGVRVRVQEGSATASSHRDHTLACLAEAGTPLDCPLTTPLRRTTLRAMVEQSLRDFRLNRSEYEWSALAYALYLPPERQWVNSEGQAVNFDRLAARIMRESIERGFCSAQHRFHTLAIFLRVDDQMLETGHSAILSSETRARVVEFLQSITATLVRHQHPDGFWNDQWPHGAPESGEPGDRVGDRLPERIIVTGHVVEWWADAPSEVHPPRSALEAASQWLVRSVDQLTPKQVADYQAFCSHVCRALAVWRGRSPAEVDLGDDPQAEDKSEPGSETAVESDAGAVNASNTPRADPP